MKKSRVIVGSVFAIILLVAVLMTTTLALFTDSKTVTNRLEAGNLEISLFQTGASGNSLNEQGYLEDYENNDRVELTKSTSADGSLFNMTNMCPSMFRKIDLELQNKGTTAFNFSITFNNVIAEGDSANALLSQINISILKGEDVLNSFKLSEALQADKVIDIDAIVEVGALENFSIKAEFLSTDSNNLVKNASASFDITITATQYVAK